MKPEDRDILFGDRFARASQWDADAGPWPMPGADIDALMDAYFDGDISDEDRVRLFELLRRDPDRCLQFVEMQRTALLLERAPAGPDQTESILNSLGRYQVSQGKQGQWHKHRIGPRVMRGAIAAMVMLAGAGLVLLGQWGPSGGTSPQRALQPGASQMAEAPESTQQSADTGVTGPGATSPDTAALASSAPLPARRPALHPGEVRSFKSLARDGSQVETPIRGLAGPDQRLVPPPSLAMDPASANATPFDPFQGFGQSSPREVRRLMDLTYGGYVPWRMYRVWSADERWTPPQPPQPQPAQPPQPPSKD